MNDLRNKILIIFNESQEITFDLENGFLSLLKLLTQENKIEFSKSLEYCLEILLTSKESFGINNIQKFMVIFLSSLGNKANDSNELNELEQTIQNELISNLIIKSNSNLDLVRERICIFIEKFLNCINSLMVNQSGDIDISLFYKLQIMLTQKFRDSSIRVQQAAIKASSSLQEPQIISCPVINEFIFFLKNDSNVETRILILETIVINQLTFNIIKNELLFDTELEIRNKALSLIAKKIPINFINCKLKKNILECLLRNNNIELFEQFLKLFFSENSKIEVFLSNLDLQKYWLAHDTDIIFNFEKLLTIMNYVFLQTLSFTEKCAEFNKLIEEENAFKNLNFSFYFSSLIFHFKINEKICFLKKNINFELDNFENLIITELSNYKTFDKILILFNLINAFLWLDENLSLNRLYVYIKALKYEPDCHYLIQAILKNLKNEETSKFIVLICTDLIEQLCNDEYEKFLTSLSIAISKINSEDFDNLETIDDLNLIEHIIVNVIPKFVSHSEISIRALSVKCIGLAAVLSEYIAETYVGFLFNILIIDTNVVVYESLKALFNILIFFYDDSKNKNEVWETILIGLENQLESMSDNKVQFIAFEGFCKLSIKKFDILPNGKRVLFKLLNGYFNETIKAEDDNDDTKKHKKKLKSCLCSFFEFFVIKKTNRIAIAKLAFKIIEENFSNKNLNIKYISQTLNYFIKDTDFQNHLIISDIIRKIKKEIKNQNIVEQWLDILIVFDLKEYKMDTNNKMESTKNLNSLSKELVEIIEILKEKKLNIEQEKWLMKIFEKLKKTNSKITK